MQAVGGRQQPGSQRPQLLPRLICCLCLYRPSRLAAKSQGRTRGSHAPHLVAAGVPDPGPARHSGRWKGQGEGRRPTPMAQRAARQPASRFLFHHPAPPSRHCFCKGFSRTQNRKHHVTFVQKAGPGRAGLLRSRAGSRAQEPPAGTEQGSGLCCGRCGLWAPRLPASPPGLPRGPVPGGGGSDLKVPSLGTPPARPDGRHQAALAGKTH